MSQIMKSFLGIFLIMLMTASSAGVLSGFLSVISAQNHHACIIGEIEDSDFNREVMETCFSMASDMEEDLKLAIYNSDGSVVYANGITDLPKDSEKIKMVRVDLAFKFRVAFFDIDESHVLSGYAR